MSAFSCSTSSASTWAVSIGMVYPLSWMAIGMVYPLSWMAFTNWSHFSLRRLAIMNSVNTSVFCAIL